MKKYLLITPLCPYPPYKNGGVHTIYNMLKNKTEEVSIDLVYYMEKDDSAERAVLEFVESIRFISLEIKKSIIQRLRCLLNRIPDQLSHIDYKAFNSNIDVSLYDAVILDQIVSLPFLDFLNEDIPVFCLMHDNVSMLYMRMLKREKRNLKKYYDKKQISFILDLENKYFDRLKKVIYVSKIDSEMAKKQHPNSKTIFDNVKLGVDIPDKKRYGARLNDSIVFSGVMDYGPNEDAALYFAGLPLKKIRSIFPDIKFVIAGKNPTEKIQQIKSDCVKLTGYVEDMVKTITESGIYVSPLRYGSGMKNKVLEAMAAEMPVFATEVSREGIDGLVDGYNCFFIDENNVAEVIIEGLKNKEKLLFVAKNGREFVERNHSWKHFFDVFSI